jgi:hypothetical protein
MLLCLYSVVARETPPVLSPAYGLMKVVDRIFAQTSISRKHTPKKSQQKRIRRYSLLEQLRRVYSPPCHSVQQYFSVAKQYDAPIFDPLIMSITGVGRTGDSGRSAGQDWKNLNGSKSRNSGDWSKRKIARHPKRNCGTHIPRTKNCGPSKWEWPRGSGQRNQKDSEG